MKKILLSALSATALVLFFAGCLKDKGFDDQKYGIKITEVRGISFPQTTSSPLPFTLVSQSTPQVIEAPVIALEASSKATQDIHVHLTLNPTLVSDAGLTAFGSSDFTVPLDVVIPAGEKTTTVKITFPNASTIDPSQSYGIGFTISAVDDGYTIANNMKDVVLSLNIQNPYEGDYQCSGSRTRYNGGSIGSGVLDVFTIDAVNYFITSSATSIDGQLADDGSGGTVRLTVDPVTNLVTCTNPPGGAYPTIVNSPSTTSTWDPVTKTFHFYCQFLNASGNLRVVDETMVKQ